jgi:TonB family protein
MIVCSKCGTKNRAENTLCINCQKELSHRSGTSTVTKTIQSPIKPINKSAIQDATVQPPYQFSYKTEPRESASNRNNPQYEAEPVEPEAQETGFDNPADLKKEKSLSKKIFTFLFVVTVPAMLYLAYVIIAKMTEEPPSPLDTRASSIFVQAENFYQNKSYLAAQNLYVQFMDEFPDDPLSEIVLARISEINSGLLSIEEEKIYRKQRILILMKKAESLFQDNKYLTSEGSNIFAYLTEVMALDSTHQQASQMLSVCIQAYKDEADKALKQGQYNTSRKYYESIVNFLPKNSDTHKQLAKINTASGKPQPDDTTSPDASQKTANMEVNTNIAAANSQKTGIENYSPADNSRKAIADESANKMAAEISPKLVSPETSEPSFSGNTAGNQKDNLAPGNSNTMYTNSAPEEKETPASSKTNAGSAVKQPVSDTEIEKMTAFNAPVLESFLDAGQRQYIKKENPVYPKPYLKINKQGMVILEVIIGTDGRVVSHRVLQSDGDLFTEACVKALRNYRYKPGTVKNNPVQFRVTESFKFKLD